MQRYKHYSFDLWLTLIKSNPEFKLKRAEYFHEHYNPKNLPVGIIDAIIRDVDSVCTVTNEIVGNNIDSLEMYSMVLYKMGNDLSRFNLGILKEIYTEISFIFFKYPPVFYDADTKHVLETLYNEGCTLSILSNTGFITGDTLDKLLIDLGIFNLFIFRIFSDKWDVSKPNPLIFSNMYHKVGTMRGDKPPLKLKDIVHVGDNPNADYQGALNHGMNAILINSMNSNGKTIRDLL